MNEISPIDELSASSDLPIRMARHMYDGRTFAVIKPCQFQVYWLERFVKEMGKPSMHGLIDDTESILLVWPHQNIPSDLKALVEVCEKHFGRVV